MQFSLLQNKQQAQERELENLQEQQERLQADYKALQQDRQRLGALLQRQSAECEALAQQHRCLETLHGDLGREHAALRKRCAQAAAGAWAPPGPSPLRSGPSCLPWTRASL